MKRKEIAKKLGITILASMLILPCAAPIVCPADTQKTTADMQQLAEEKAEASDQESKAGEAEVPDQEPEVGEAQTSDQEPEDGTTDQAQDQTSAALKLSTKTFEKEYKTKEGLLYKKISFTYPVAEGNSEAAQTFNNFYKKVLAKWKKATKENLKDAKEVVTAMQNEEGDRYFTDEVACEITSEDEKYISVLQSGYDYAMGAHGMPYRYTYIFDAKTGKKVSAANLLGMSKKQLNEKVRSLYIKRYDKTQKEGNYLFYPNKEEVKATLAKMDFNNNLYYLKNGKVRFYADPYALGPYAAGFIEVAIKM